MKTASAQARDRWRLTSAEQRVPPEQSDMCATSGTHVVSSPERTLTELQRERDELAGRLQGALAEVARLSTLVESLTPPAPVAPQLPFVERSVSALSHLELRTADERTLEVVFLAESHFIAGFDQDVARGGVFVVTYEELELGAQVALTFEFGEQLVQARGEVRWALGERDDAEQRPGFAIFFSELDGDAASLVADYWRAHPPRFYEV